MNNIIYVIGTGNDNVELDVEIEEEGDEINDERPKAANSQAIYANMLDISHSVPVTRLAAYVEEKRRNSGFKKEFGVSYSSNKYFDIRDTILIYFVVQSN